MLRLKSCRLECVAVCNIYNQDYILYFNRLDYYSSLDCFVDCSLWNISVEKELPHLFKCLRCTMVDDQWMRKVIIRLLLHFLCFKRPNYDRFHQTTYGEELTKEVNCILFTTNAQSRGSCEWIDHMASNLAFDSSPFISSSILAVSLKTPAQFFKKHLLFKFAHITCVMYSRERKNRQIVVVLICQHLLWIDKLYFHNLIDQNERSTRSIENLVL